MRDCPACDGEGVLPEDDPIFRHYVEFTEEGYAMQHAYECRPDMLNCPYWVAIQRDPHLPHPGFGWFRMTMSDGKITFTPDEIGHT